MSAPAFAHGGNHDRWRAGGAYHGAFAFPARTYQMENPQAKDSLGFSALS